MKNHNVEAFNIKSGPTQSGDGAAPIDGSVGGEILSIDKLSVFISQYWLLLLLILIPFSYVLYKKRHRLPAVFYKLQTILIRLKPNI